MNNEPPMDPNLKIPEQQTSGIEYKMFGDGRIFRIDHENSDEKTLMAKHDGENLVYENMNARKFHPRIGAYLKKSGVEYAEIYVKEGSNPAPETAPAPETGPPKAASGGALVFSSAADVPQEVVQEAIPPPPLMNKRDGDKTKAYVEWMEKYHPLEYEKKYGIIGPGTVTKFHKVPHEEIHGRFHREPYQKPALLSRRKTHLTEKPDQQGDAEYAPIPKEEEVEES